MKALSLVLAFVCIVLAGCSRTESENVSSNGIYAEIELVANEGGYTDVEVRLRVGGPLSLTQLELSGSDRLLAHANGITKELSMSGHILDLSYKARFDFIDADTEFRVELVRGIDVSAPNSVATLPLGFSLSTPDGQTYARDQDITVSWDPAFTPDIMHVTYKTTCQPSAGGIYTASQGIGLIDNGQYTINASELITDDPLFAGVDCEINIQVNRKRYGTVDGNYGEGGWFLARQRRSVTVSVLANIP